MLSQYRNNINGNSLLHKDQSEEKKCTLSTTQTYNKPQHKLV